MPTKSELEEALAEKERQLAEMMQERADLAGQAGAAAVPTEPPTCLVLQPSCSRSKRP